VPAGIASRLAPLIEYKEKNMRKLLTAVAFVSLCAFTAQAQSTGGEIARIYLNTPKAGGAKAFEAGRKKHMEWHRSQNDAWSWLTWQILTGERADAYYTGTFGHAWKEFDGRDAFEAADDADAAVNLDPFTSSSVPMIYRYLSKASRPTGSAEPSPFSQLTFYYVKLEGVPEFSRAIEKVKDALDKANWPVHAEWYGLVSGGEGPLYVVSVERSSWAEFAPTEKTLDMVVAEATSVAESNALFDAIRKNTTKVYTEILRYRPDLSYVAKSK
jgi:hypothetical protein